MHYARQLAAWLSHYSQLPQLAEQGTGPQHDLNDLRSNAWLTKRMAGSRNGSNDTIEGTSPSQAADLPAIGQPPVQNGGRMTIRFVYLLSLTCLAGFVVQLYWHLQSQSLWSAVSTYRWGYVFTLVFPALTLYIRIRDRLPKK